MTITVDPRTEVTFAQRGNNITAVWLEVQSADDAQPDDLLKALTGVGWTVNPRFTPRVTAPLPDDTRPENQPAYAVRHLIVGGPSGSGPHGAWTLDESQANVAAARQVLAEFGFPNVQTWRKSKADQL